MGNAKYGMVSLFPFAALDSHEKTKQMTVDTSTDLGLKH